MLIRGPDGRVTPFAYRTAEFWAWLRRYCEGVVPSRRDPGEAAIAGLYLDYAIGLFATQDTLGLSRANWSRLRRRAAGQIGRKLTQTRALIAQHFEVIDDADDDPD